MVAAWSIVMGPFTGDQSETQPGGEPETLKAEAAGRVVGCSPRTPMIRWLPQPIPGWLGCCLVRTAGWRSMPAGEAPC